MFEEISIAFENPATDPMGFGATSGKLTCLRDSVRLQFKERDRAFRKNETEVIDFAYGEVENVEVVRRWFRPILLVLETRALGKLDSFPGSKVGRVELVIGKSAHRTARRMIGVIEFQKLERLLRESEARLGRKLEG